MTTIELIQSYAAGLFSELSCDVSVKRDPNTTKFVLRVESKPFNAAAEAEIDENIINSDMEATVRATRDHLVFLVMGGQAPLRSPEEPAAAVSDTEPPTAEAHDSPVSG